jgi:conjugative relaxase-like TrwC/TraI family protein
VLTIGRLGHGSAAADYYIDRQCGCELDYYTGDGEPRGVWCGSGARALGFAATLDGAGEAALRGVLAGLGPDGSTIAGPVWRGDPRGRLPAARLVTAVCEKAAARGVDLATMLGDGGLLEALQKIEGTAAADLRLPRRPRATVRADVAGQICAAVGLDPQEVFPAGHGERGHLDALDFVSARVDVRRAGLDLTFSAPKSVSTLFGLSDPAIAAEVREAHRTAIEQTVEYLERLCARAARGHHKPGEPYKRIDTDGWVAVAFEHRTSRCDDPQLHTHVVVANVVRGVDGRWSAWDTSEAYRQASTGGYLYQAVLRGELSRRLGVQWGPVRRGVAEIEKVSVGLRRLFSQRRDAIEAHLAEHGQVGPRAAQVAALATRPSKHHRSDADLREEWADRAVAAGFDPRVVTADAVNRNPARSTEVETSRDNIDADRIAATVLGTRGVTARSSSFDRRALLRAVCEAVPAGSAVTVDNLREVATDVIRDGAVVPLVTGSAPGERRYSTADLLATEASALHAASGRATDGVGLVAPEVVDAALATASLSDEQAAAVRRITTSGAGVEIVVGPAGAGKTAALLAAHSAWRSAGLDVRGASLAAIASRTLEAGTEIPSQSLTRLTRAIGMGDPERGLPAPGGVLVVDEAGMVGTRDLAELIEITNQALVKLVLVGDPNQLPEIDAGGLFAALTRSLPASVLSGNMRQREPWERAALQALRDGDVLDAVNAYDNAGRLHLTDDAPTAREAIIVDYMTVRDTAPSTVMLTSRRVDARVLNTLTRRALLAHGGLGSESLTVQSGNRTVEWRVGDEAVVTANHYPLGLINGSRGRVSRVDDAGITLQTDVGPVDVPTASLQAGVVEYGYALTCHKAQGITVDVSLVYASGALTREAGYVGMSRGRVANHLYGTLDALLPEVDAELDHPADDPIASAERTELTRAALVQRLETRGAQRLAFAQADRSVQDRVREWVVPSAAGRAR